MSSLSESLLLYLFQEEVKKAEILQRGLKFDSFKPRLKSCIFKCISWLNGLYFGGDERDFLKEGLKIYLIAPMSPLNMPTSSLYSRL